jgi:hypothetical protein
VSSHLLNAVPQSLLCSLEFVSQRFLPTVLAKIFPCCLGLQRPNLI